MIKIINCFILLCFWLCIFSVIVEANSSKPLYKVSFDDYKTGDEREWLAGKGFEFKEDAKYRTRVLFTGDNDRLNVEVERRAFGIMLNESVDISDFSYVEIDWGVNIYPKGSSYEQGVRNEAIMLIVFLGDERMPSGAFFIPNSPYFIGLYLCHGDDRMNFPYTGRYYKKSGRYVCVDRPEPGNMVTSRFNLMQAYREYFDKEEDDNPAVSGFAIAGDTKRASNGGNASAFIREIRFYK